jgi:hypothetical protein
MVATGTRGTCWRMAKRMKPLRLASTAVSRLRQLRMASCSPPGQSTTSWPAERAAPIASLVGGMTPVARK